MNKKITLFISTIILIGAVILVLTGSNTFDNFREAFFEEQGAASDTITIGVLEPQTGNDSAGGALEIEGIQLANELKSTVLGKKVELVYADTQSNIYTAETAVQDLITKKPVVILGSYGDAASVVAGQYIEDAKIPAITITATNPLITINNEYYFRASFVEENQGYALADYTVNYLKQTTAGVIRIKDDDTSRSMVAKYDNRLKELTGNDNALTTTIEIDLEATDYTPYMEALQESNCRAIFMPVDIATAEKVFDAATKANLVNIDFILPKDLHTEELTDLQEEYPSIKISVASDFSSNTEEEAVDGEQSVHDQFVAAYQDKYGKDAEPSEAAALAFDAYMLAVEAIEKAGSIDGFLVKNALAATAGYEGASGDITFSASGDPTKPINIDVIKGTTFVSVYSVK